MNIFFVDRNPIIAAQSLCDQHVVKMTLETAQILSTICSKYQLDKSLDLKVYRSTHAKHPSVVWTGKSFEHFYWLLQHGLALATEYSSRYNKVHKSEKIMLDILHNLQKIKKSNVFPNKGWEDPPVAVKPEWRANVVVFEGSNIDVVRSYRNYYKLHKLTFGTVKVRPATWKKNKPVWL